MKSLYLCLISFLLFPANLNANYYFAFFDNPKYQQDFKHFDYVNPKAPKSGHLRIGGVGSFDSLNPFILQGQSGDGIGFLFDSLMSRSKDELASAYPLIAKSININHELSTISFNLNEAARFSDNSLLTAYDVKFTFDTLKTKGHPRYKIALRDITEITIIDNHQIQFSLADISNKDLILVILEIPIFSQKFFDNNDFTKPTLEPILGSGPYIIEKITPGKSIAYKRNNNYWAKNLPVNSGTYNFELVSYIYYRDSDIAIRALKANEYDFRHENIAKNWMTAYNKSSTPLHLKQELIKHSIPSGMQCFALNNRLEKFSNIKVRKALNLAFDFEWTNNNLFFGSYSRTTSFFNNSIFQSSDYITKSEYQLIKSLNYTDNEIANLSDIEIPVNNDSNNRKYLLEAQNLLKEAGYIIQDSKLIDPITKQEFTIEFLITSPSFKRVILPYINNLKKLGITANIKLVDFSIYQKRLETFNFDIAVTVFPGSMIPGNELYAYLHSTNKDISGSRNLAGIANKRVDELVTKIPAITNLDDLKTYTSLLDKVLLSNYYIIPHWNIGAFRLVYSDNITHPKNTPQYDLCLECWYETQ